MVAEGIILQTVDYQERDLVVKMLTRQGTKLSLFVYGGQGGGTKKKPKIFQPGSLLKVETQRDKKNSNEGLKIVKDSKVLWQSEHIRYSSQAFYFQCFYLEMINKVSQYYQDEISISEEMQGIFTVLSNALFYLDQECKKDQHLWLNHLMFFQVKLIYHLGLTPQLDYCVYCQGPLVIQQSWLIPSEGGFSCRACQGNKEILGSSNLLFHFKFIFEKKYENVFSLHSVVSSDAKELLQFLLFHLQIKESDFKTTSLVFH